jgi:Tfp pilus assembly protein FimT
LKVKLHSLSSRSGFTILELGIVLVIMAMVTYTVSVSFDAFVPRERLNTSVRDLADVLRQARSESVSRNSEYFVEYDMVEHRYRMITPLSLDGQPWIEGVDPEDFRRATNWEHLRQGVVFDSVTLAGTIYTEELVRVRFDPLGSASDHIVQISQPLYEISFTLEVLPLTGLIRFHEGIYERDYPTDLDFN